MSTFLKSSCLVLLALAGFASAPDRARAVTESELAATDSLFVVFFRTGKGFLPGRPSAEQPGFTGHARHMRDLSMAGKILLGGPYGIDPARFHFAGTLLLMRARDRVEARRLVAGDPGVASGLLELESVHVFVPATGRLAAALETPPGAPGPARRKEGQHE